MNALARERLREAPRPFFAFMNYMESHSPYLRFWPVGGAFVPHRLLLGRRWRMWRHHRQAREWDQLARADSGLLRLLGDLYDEDIAYADRRIGELLSDLEADGVLKDTLVVVTSDHGEHLGEHGLVQHHFSLYDALLRVPLIACWKGHIRAGTTVTAQVQLTDVAPSVWQVAESHSQQQDRPNILAPESMEGLDCPAYAQYNLPREVLERWGIRNRFFDFAPFRRDLVAIRHKGYKYISGSDGSRELYDLRADPGETDNVIEKHGGRARSLASSLDQWLQRHPPLANEGEVTGDTEVESKLRELGYL
jgi:arylsulfatase A-like enzyme